MTFKALLLDNQPSFITRLADLDESELPEGDVTIRVTYSTLNYKDALAIANRGPIVRTWPMVAGIDAAGVVETSDDPAFRPGDAVVLNGWGLGETRWGGLAQRTRCPGEWLVKLPAPLTPFAAAAIGTAGYTATLCVQALERHGLEPADGPVLVTGATGGVGSVAVALLARAGFQVTALTGKPEDAAYLKGLGAAEVLDRAELSGQGKPLQKEQFAGVVDALGSTVLANACARVRRNGAVAACGLAMGMDFNATMAPFILRGISLYGIDSVYAGQGRRQAAWARLAESLDAATLGAIAEEIPLTGVIPAVERIITGRMRGRFVVDVNR